MPAPTYTWKYVYDLWGGERTPVVATLEATSGLYTVKGTLLIMNGGQVDEAGDSAAEIIGIAAEDVSDANAADPVKVELIAPGMVIRGTADADASAEAGFDHKTVDLNANGSLDVTDTSNGCLAVYRTNNSAGTEVDCIICSGAWIEA